MPALALAKISLIILYHRIMKKQKIYVMALHAITAVVMGYSISIIFALILACHPVSRNWDPTVEGECVNRTALYIATAVTNIVTDLALITLPIPLVLRLNMPRSQKVYLFLMFVVGCAYVISIFLFSKKRSVANDYIELSSRVSCAWSPWWTSSTPQT